MVLSHSHREDDFVDSVFGFGFCGSVCPLFEDILSSSLEFIGESRRVDVSVR